MACPCGVGTTFEECCQPVIKGRRKARTAEQLMRARYSAYATGDVGYILETSHRNLRATLDEKATREWSEKSTWEKLEIVRVEKGGLKDDEGSVEFRAHYRVEGTQRVHHEVASFKKEENRWYFTDGEMVTPRPFTRQEPKVGRNDPCPCGSGKKYKKCHGPVDGQKPAVEVTPA